MEIQKFFKDRGLLLGYKIANAIAEVIPFELGSKIGVFGGSLAYLANPKRRLVVRNNLAPVVGTQGVYLEAFVARSFVSYAQYWFESFKMGTASRSMILSHGRSEGMESLYEAIAQGRGAIVVAPHLGNWDFGAAWFDTDRIGVNAVVEGLEPQELYEWFLELRTRFGVKPIRHDDNPMPKIVAALRANEVVAIVADRSLDASSVEVDFFSRKISMPLGPAIMALRTGAPLLPTAVFMEANGGHCMRMLPEIKVGERTNLRSDAKRLTQEIAYAFETLISQAPEQWHVFQPLFDNSNLK
ncbi:lysophospholipid acyltransferase family protein [Acidithrix ferrooxidans]|uniref:Phosphatidylinositol mannoside acyltransferase n=2 Tax=root TaxID=1 RepID=A0A0D8HLV4_9ACTN|nr:hypothetical protein [Acidithrix ferrooxidans]KJF18081.1 phosphatidylinositol mannoside acyltransferase [Acidithrix ferrooxidans]